MITRTYNISDIPYLREEFPGVDTEEWVSNKDNIALTDGSGNYSMFEKGSDGVYTGHYFFESRGRQALRVAREMLDFAFNECGLNIIRGITPLTHLGARWLSRQLGFKSYGIIQPGNGPCELFILVKEQ